MKAEFNLTVDEKGKPVIEFRCYDKGQYSDALEQKLLKIFVEEGISEGIQISGINGHLSNGNGHTNYKIEINENRLSKEEKRTLLNRIKDI